ATSGAAGSAHPDVHAIVFPPNYDGSLNSPVWLATDGAIYASTNANAATGTLGCSGSTSHTIGWTPRRNGLAITQFYGGAVYADGDRLFGGTQDNGTLRGSSGSPATWQQLTCGDGVDTAINPQNEATIYTNCQYGNVLRSTNGNTTNPSFTSANTGLDDDFAFLTPLVIDRNTPTRLWTGGNYLWRTNNGATSWERMQGWGGITAIAVAPGRSQRVLFATMNNLLWSDNATAAANVASWTYSANAYNTTSDIEFAPGDPDRVYKTSSQYGSYRKVMMSINGGRSFFEADGDALGNGRLPDVPANTIAVDPDTRALYVGTDAGVFVSRDDGEHWLVEDTGFPNTRVEHLEFSGTGPTRRLFAFTHGRSAFRVTPQAGSALAPRILGLPATVAMLEDTPLDLPFQVADDDTPVASLTARANRDGSNDNVLGNVYVDGTDGTRTLHLFGGYESSGSASVLVRVSDGVRGATQVVRIDVLPVNDAPYIGIGTIYYCAALAGAVSFPADAVEIRLPRDRDDLLRCANALTFDPRESGQTLLDVAVEPLPGNAAVFAQAPTIGLDRELQMRLNGTPGTAELDVRARDDGGTANGGVDWSAPVRLRIVVEDRFDRILRDGFE
ncbi:MAG TPA: hypothetical protein VFL14_09970, partial [Xanthomonadales bacterium]|nr:hypothetical protein [Xanthomonadales bacterium]